MAVPSGMAVRAMCFWASPQGIVEQAIRLVEVLRAKRREAAAQLLLDRRPSLLGALRRKAVVADPPIIVDEDAGPAGRLVFLALKRQWGRLMHVKRFSSLRLSPVGFTPYSAKYARTISICSLRSPSGMAAKSIWGSDGSSAGTIAVPAILFNKSSGATSSFSGAESVWQSRLGRSFVDSFWFFDPAARVMRPGLPTDVSMWQPASSNFCASACRNRRTRLTESGTLGRSIRTQQSAAVAGIVFDDGLGRASLVDQELLDRLDLLQRRLVFGVRAAYLAALGVVPLGIAVNEDEPQPHDVGIGTRLAASVERCRLESGIERIEVRVDVVAFLIGFAHRVGEVVGVVEIADNDPFRADPAQLAGAAAQQIVEPLGLRRAGRWALVWVRLSWMPSLVIVVPTMLSQGRKLMGRRNTMQCRYLGRKMAVCPNVPWLPYTFPIGIRSACAVRMCICTYTHEAAFFASIKISFR